MKSNDEMQISDLARNVPAVIQPSRNDDDTVMDCPVCGRPLGNDHRYFKVSLPKARPQRLRVLSKLVAILNLQAQLKIQCFDHFHHATGKVYVRNCLYQGEIALNLTFPEALQEGKEDDHEG